MHHESGLRPRVRAVNRPRLEFHNYLLRKFWLPVYATLFASLTACDPGVTLSDGSSNYRSTWSELYPETLQSEYNTDTLQGAFYFAAAAQTPLEAKNRWSRFLAEWDPPHEEFEDAMHANLVAWAKLERRRVEALANDPAELKIVNQQLRALRAQLE
jgi:hypothetical protein